MRSGILYKLDTGILCGYGCEQNVQISERTNQAILIVFKPKWKPQINSIQQAEEEMKAQYKLYVIFI